MRNYFTLGGTDSRTMGVYISGQGAFSAPARSYDFISVPNRNGDLLGIDTRLLNGTLTYPAFICTNFKSNVADFRAFLLSQTGWMRLEDTYNHDEYRMVVYQGPFEPNVTMINDAGSFDITFTCKPQRFLKSGETATTFTANGTISNPTKFNAQPLIRVYGTGTVGIGSTTITISSADVYTDIDCEIMDCFKGSTSKNQYVSFSGNDFPVLKSGSNGVSLGTGITKVEITPRWWTV